METEMEIVVHALFWCSDLSGLPLESISVTIIL